MKEKVMAKKQFQIAAQTTEIDAVDQIETFEEQATEVVIDDVPEAEIELAHPEAEVVEQTSEEVTVDADETSDDDEEVAVAAEQPATQPLQYTLEQIQEMLRDALFKKAATGADALAAALHDKDTASAQEHMKELLKDMAQLGASVSIATAPAAAQPTTHTTGNASKAQMVRDYIRNLKDTGISGADTIERTVKWAVEVLHFTPALAKTYVSNNFAKVFG